ncbi:MAG: TolC family protein [Saprospiraceae bacterium]
MTRKNIIKIALLVILFAKINNIKAQQIFSNLDSLLQYATLNSRSLYAGEIRLDQAKRAKLATLVGIADPAGGATFTYTNNTRLPVNLFPAEIFGGDPGTFTEIQTGVQYVSNQNFYAEIKLLNLQGWENLKLYKLNIDATNTSNKLNVKRFYENIAAIYYNIINLQEQRLAATENRIVADTLRQITQRKYEQGIVNQQDVNNAIVNYLNTEESIRQAEFMIAQQYLALKILCDISENDSIYINENIITQPLAESLPIELNELNVNSNLLQEKVSFSNYRRLKLGIAPTVSLFLSQTNQQFNTRARLFDGDVRWIPSNYIGIKINIPLPAANLLSQIHSAKYEYQLALNNTAQTRIQSNLQQTQLRVNYDKAVSQLAVNEQIYNIRQDTYNKNLLNYKEGIIGMEQTLQSFNDTVNSQYNLIAAKINVLLAQANININNKVK